MAWVWCASVNVLWEPPPVVKTPFNCFDSKQIQQQVSLFLIYWLMWKVCEQSSWKILIWLSGLKIIGDVIGSIYLKILSNTVFLVSVAPRFSRIPLELHPSRKSPIVSIWLQTATLGHLLLFCFCFLAHFFSLKTFPSWRIPPGQFHPMQGLCLWNI